MRPRRVTYTTPLPFDAAGFVGGGERYAHNLALGVAEAGAGEVEVRLVTFGAAPEEREVASGVRMRVLRRAGPAPSRFDGLSWEIDEALEGSDVVHVHQPFNRAGEIALAAAALQGIPVFLTDHGGVRSRLGSSVGLQELARGWLAYSEFGGSLLRTDRPVHVVRGGVDARHFTPPAQPPRRQGFLYVGRLLGHKGVDRLIRALPADLPLTVCGQAHDDDYLRLLQDLARGKQVEFLDDVDDAGLIERYRGAWATVLPSVHRDHLGRWHRAPELMGLTLLESMACGTPVVCSDAGAMAEFVREGETGFVAGDEATLADRLRRLAENAALVESMGRRGREVVEAEYDIRVVGARVLDEVYAG